MSIHQLENCKLKCNPPQHRYALNISFFCTDKSSSNFYPNRGVQDGEWGNQTLTHALELGNVACNTISGIFAVRMIETCLPSPSSRAKHCRTIWEMKFPTSPPLCFQSHTIVAQQKKSKAQHFSTSFSQNLQFTKLFLKRISIRVNFEEKSFAFLSLGPVNLVWWFSELAKDWSRTPLTLSTNDLFQFFQMIYDARIFDNIGKAVMSFILMT